MSRVPTDQSKECPVSRLVGLVHHKLHANSIFDSAAGFVASCRTRMYK